MLCRDGCLCGLWMHCWFADAFVNGFKLSFQQEVSVRACTECDGCGRSAYAPRILVEWQSGSVMVAGCRVLALVPCGRGLCREVLRSCTPHAAAFTR